MGSSRGDGAQESAAPRAPAGLTDAMPSAVYTVIEPAVPNQPKSSGGAIVQDTIDPALPSRLRLNGSTGIRVLLTETVDSSATS